MKVYKNRMVITSENSFKRILFRVHLPTEGVSGDRLVGAGVSDEDELIASGRYFRRNSPEKVESKLLHN